MPDDDKDEHHAVFRQDTVLTMRDVERALALGRSREDIKAGGLYCSHGSEMTFCICTTKANHFRHVVAPTTPGNGPGKGPGNNTTNGCGCSARHLDAQTVLRDHDYAKQPVRFTEWRDCLKPECCKTVFEASSGETLTVRLEVREQNGKFVSDAVYYREDDDAVAKACMRVEVFATHKADRSRRVGTEFVEVAAQHIVDSFKKAGNSSPITLRCEGSCTGTYEVCHPCVKRKRIAREQAEARRREAQRQEAERRERARQQEAERQRLRAEERVREEERRRRREAEAERRRQEAEEQRRAREAEAEERRRKEETLKLHRWARNAEAERARRLEAEQRQEAERVQIAALDAARAVREAERAEVAASMEVPTLPSFRVTLGTDVPPTSQEEIERRRAERMARQQEQQAKGRRRGRNKRPR